MEDIIIILVNNNELTILAKLCMTSKQILDICNSNNTLDYLSVINKISTKPRSLNELMLLITLKYSDPKTSFIKIMNSGLTEHLETLILKVPNLYLKLVDDDTVDIMYGYYSCENGFNCTYKSNRLNGFNNYSTTWICDNCSARRNYKDTLKIRIMLWLRNSGTNFQNILNDIELDNDVYAAAYLHKICSIVSNPIINNMTLEHDKICESFANGLITCDPVVVQYYNKIYGR